MNVKLPKIEICLYFVIWISSFSFAFYKVYCDGERELSHNSRASDFVEGWKWLDRRKDISDGEWELWAEFLFRLIPWIVFHLFVSQIIKTFFNEALPLCYLLTTMGFLICYFPLTVPAFFILQLLIFFLTMITASKTIIWSLGIVLLLFVNNNIQSFKLNQGMTEDQLNIIHVCNGWFYIRCLYFVLIEAEEKLPLSQQFFNYIAYIFYLPCFFLGPFIPYESFKTQLYAPSGSYSKRQIVNFAISSLSYIAYYISYEAALHYLYCNAMHYEIKNYVPLGTWTLSGIGICLANFFYLKYVIIYGFAMTIAKAENYAVPPHPKCIYRIHLYSSMWRHFDRGFYLFLFRCIYAPVCGQQGASIGRRSFASFLCFAFVFIWHGGTRTIFYWSMFNYIGLIIESICKYIWKVYFNEGKNMSTINSRRIKALASSPLWLLAVISNFIFFGGHEMGLLFIKHLAEGSVLFHATLILISYSMCQVSIETSDWKVKNN